MTRTDLNEKSLKKVVTERARELGHRLRPSAVTLELPPEEVAAGCRLFRAWWGPGRRGGAVSGLLEEGQPPDTWPQRALTKLFRRWLQSGGTLPDPALVARVAAYLYDPLGRKMAILTPDDLAKLGAGPIAHLPEAISGEEGPGVVFCWVGPDGASEIRFYLDQDGDVWTRESRLQGD